MLTGTLQCRSRQLKQQGLEVSVANDGQQALDMLQEDAEKIKSASSTSDGERVPPFHGINVVLMDIEVSLRLPVGASLAPRLPNFVTTLFQMPVMDGLTAIRELRRREKAGEMPHHYVRLFVPALPSFSRNLPSRMSSQPVCAVTGNARDAQKSECLEAGFDDVSAA